MRPEVVRDISKSVLSKSSLHKLRALIEKFWDRNVYKVWEWRDCYYWRLFGFVTFVISIIIIVLLLVLFGRVDIFIPFSVLCVIAFHKVYVAMLWRLCIFSKFCKGEYWYYRGTQRQFSENICSEDDLRSRIFGTFVVKFLACLPLLGFSSIWKML